MLVRLRSALVAAALMISVGLFGSLKGDAMPFVTRELIDGYIISIPTAFELKPQSYRDVLDGAVRSRGSLDPKSKLLLVVGKWSRSMQSAFIGVRTHPEWDRLYPQVGTLTPSDWASLHEQMLTRITRRFDEIGAKLIERFRPVLSSTKAGDQQVVLRYRRRTANTTTAAGLFMFIRPQNSFGVEFSYDENAGTGPLVELALSSIGHP